MITLYGIKNCDTIKKKRAIGWRNMALIIVFTITVWMA